MSEGLQNPIFFHAYPSNEGTPAFAVEVYWNLSDNSASNGYLVNPLQVTKWQGWFDVYMKKHYVTIKDFNDYGTEPYLICKELNKNLAVKEVFTEDLERTNYLMRELFTVTQEEMNFVLKPLNEFLFMLLTKQGLENTEAKLEMLREKARRETLAKGGASEMVYLERLWKSVLQEAK